MFLFRSARRSLCAAAVLLSTASAAQPLGASLQSLLDYARSANPQFASMQREADAAAARVEPAGNLPDAVVAIEWRDITRDGQSNVNLLPARVGSMKYTVRQMIPWPGKRDLARAAASASADQATQSAQAMWNELAMQIKVAHARRVELAQRGAIVREIDSLLAQLESISRARYAGGLVVQADAVRALSERTMLNGELIAIAAEARSADAQLNALLARDPDAPLSAPALETTVPSAPDFATLASRLRDRSPEVAADGARLAGAERSRDLSYRNRYPDFAIALSPIQKRNRLADWELMFEITIPLQQGTRRAQEREADAMVSAAVARREATVQRALGELGVALAQMRAAQQMNHLLDTQLLPQARINLQAALAAYENGKVDFATLLEAERQVRQARLSIVKSQFEAQMRRAEIERLVGGDL